MHEIVVTGQMPGLLAQHLGGERAQLGRQVVLVQAFERPGHHTAYQHPGRCLLHRGHIRGGGPGEDLDLDPPLGQLERGLEDVDVHPARITGTGLCQW